MYIIESGRIRITVTDADGREVILASLGHGDFFGEMAMLDGHGRSADATVTEDSRLAVLTRENFPTFVLEDSRTVWKCVEPITQRLRRTVLIFFDIGFRGTPTKKTRGILPWPTAPQIRSLSSAEAGNSLVGIDRFSTCLGNCAQYLVASRQTLRSVSLRLP